MLSIPYDNCKRYVNVNKYLNSGTAFNDIYDTNCVFVCVILLQISRSDGTASGGAGHNRGHRLRSCLHTGPQNPRRNVHSDIQILCWLVWQDPGVYVSVSVSDIFVGATHKINISSFGSNLNIRPDASSIQLSGRCLSLFLSDKGWRIMCFVVSRLDDNLQFFCFINRKRKWSNYLWLF